MTTEKPSKNEDEYFARQDAELLEKSRLKAEAEQQAAERKSHYMKCPKDGYDLTSEDFHGVQVERCAHCGGLWLDAGEIDAIAKHEDRGGLMGRVFGDVLSSFRGGGGRPAHG